MSSRATLLQAVLVCSLLCSGSASYAAGAANQEWLPLKKALIVLQKSTNRDKLLHAAQSLIHSKDTNALGHLETFLLDPTFLSRLDKRKLRYTGWLIRDILNEIAKSGTPKAQAMLLKLAALEPYYPPPLTKEEMAAYKKIVVARMRGEKTKPSKPSKGEQNHPGWVRRDALVGACVYIRNPTEALLHFLNWVYVIENTNSIPVILIQMQSPKAARLVAKYTLNEKFEVYPEDYTNDAMSLRNSPAIVGLYRQLLSAEIKNAKLRNTIVQTLFSYNPNEWYPRLSHSNSTPPPRAKASTKVLQEVLLIADIAVKLDIPEATKAAVRAEKKKILRILDDRKKGIIRPKSKPQEEEEEKEKEEEKE